MTTALTMTISQACLRHVGLAPATLRKMCLKKEIKSQLVGKCYHIPIQELDRKFLGITGRK